MVNQDLIGLKVMILPMVILMKRMIDIWRKDFVFQGQDRLSAAMDYPNKHVLMVDVRRYSLSLRNPICITHSAPI